MVGKSCFTFFLTLNNNFLTIENAVEYELKKVILEEIQFTELLTISCSVHMPMNLAKKHARRGKPVSKNNQVLVRIGGVYDSNFSLVSPFGLPKSGTATYLELKLTSELLPPLNTNSTVEWRLDREVVSEKCNSELPSLICC